ISDFDQGFNEAIIECLNRIKALRNPRRRKCDVMRSIGREDPSERMAVNTYEEVLDVIREIRDEQ
ncbi:MAG: hypothetical protein P1V97_23525, partial [Planctomycetota bacterium]|nr:hypothetical protein [Planctomycetota bacterium]